jgi:hypothetical protein
VHMHKHYEYNSKLPMTAVPTTAEGLTTNYSMKQST